MPPSPSRGHSDERDRSAYLPCSPAWCIRAGEAGRDLPPSPIPGSCCCLSNTLRSEEDSSLTPPIRLKRPRNLLCSQNQAKICSGATRSWVTCCVLLFEGGRIDDVPPLTLSGSLQRAIAQDLGPRSHDQLEHLLLNCLQKGKGGDL